MSLSNFLPAIFGGVLLLGNACQTNPYTDGENVYKQACANCHMDNGEGLGGLIPPLAGADYLKINREKLPCLVKHGIEGEIAVNGKTYSEKMDGMTKINDIDLTNVLNYVNNAWGNDNGVFRLDEVQDYLNRCK